MSNSLPTLLHKTQTTTSNWQTKNPWVFSRSSFVISYVRAAQELVELDGLELATLGKSPLRIGLWDPFQMAIHGLSMGVTKHRNVCWDVAVYADMTWTMKYWLQYLIGFWQDPYIGLWQN